MGKTIFNVSVVDQSIVFLTKPKLASGGVEENEIHFMFDNLWDGYAKTAVFYKTKDEVYHIAISDNVATIPAEVTDEKGEFFFGVFGDKDGTTRTTEVLQIEVVEGAITIATARPGDPTPDIYSQILQIANDAKNIAQEVRDEFDSGVVPALLDQNSDKGIRIWTGTKEEYLAQKDNLSPGTLCIITDDPADYIVYRDDYTVKYSNGRAEAKFSVRLDNVPVNTAYGSTGWYRSTGFTVNYLNEIDEHIIEVPKFCRVALMSAYETESEAEYFASLLFAGKHTEAKTQGIVVISPASCDKVTVRLEVDIEFNWK